MSTAKKETEQTKPEEVLGPERLMVDPTIAFCTSTQVGYNVEFFLLGMMAGNAVSRFAYSPQHAKRLQVVLTKKIEQYEKAYGEIKTELTDPPNQS